MAIQRARLQDELEQSFFDTIRAIVATIDAKDGYTHRHSERVATFAVRLARELGRETDELVMIRLAAMVHDVGKVGVPEAILNKPGRLTEAEFDQMKLHPIHGANILRHIQSPMLERILPGVLAHHERWDGSGYPEAAGRPRDPVPRPAAGGGGRARCPVVGAAVPRVGLVRRRHRAAAPQVGHRLRPRDRRGRGHAAPARRARGPDREPRSGRAPSARERRSRRSAAALPRRRQSRRSSPAVMEVVDSHQRRLHARRGCVALRRRAPPLRGWPPARASSRAAPGRSVRAACWSLQPLHTPLGRRSPPVLPAGGCSRHPPPARGGGGGAARRGIVSHFARQGSVSRGSVGQSPMDEGIAGRRDGRRAGAGTRTRTPRGGGF